MTEAPEIECPDCDGWGFIRENADDIIGTTCAACDGSGWRPMTDAEQNAAAERQAADNMSEPPMSLDEQHARAWAQKQDLRS